MGKISQAELDLGTKWQLEMQSFVDYFWPVEEVVKEIPSFTGWSTQQKQGFKEMSKLIVAKHKKAYKLPLTKEEKVYSEKIGLSIQSANGCHAKGTKILMYNGLTKNVEDIQVNDLLVGDDGSCRRVQSLARGKEQMYRLQYPWGDYYDVNENHILSLVATGRTGKRKTGDKIDVVLKDYLKWNKDKIRCHSAYKCRVDYFERLNKIVKIDPYILGVWLGDGNSLTSSFYGIDKEVIDELKKYFNCIGLKYRNRIIKEHYFNGIQGKKNIFIENLKYYNLRGNKHIPYIYKTANRKIRLQLLAGLLDTDGHLDQRNKRVFTIIQKNEALAEDILFLARSLGFHATLTEKVKTWTWKNIKKSGLYYEVSISRGDLHEIPTRIPRKQAVKAKINVKKNHHNFSVRKLNIDDFYGFSLDGNGRFLGSDFTVLHNTGKDCFLAICIIYFTFIFPNSQSLATASTKNQLKNVLWKEIAKWLRASRRATKDSRLTLLQERLELQSEKLFVRDLKGKESFCEAVTVNTKKSGEEQAQSIAGRHEDFMIAAIDEGSDIADPVFQKLERTLTRMLNLMITIFNPIRSKGYAIESQSDKRFVALHWSAEDSELVEKSHIEAMEKKYGRDSNSFRVSILGLPPIVDESVVFPWDWLEDACRRDYEPLDNDPVVGALDCGGGGDMSVSGVRKGFKIYPWKTNNSPDSNELESWALQHIREINPSLYYVDKNGLGYHVYYRLRKLVGLSVKSVEGQGRADDEMRFFNKRAENIWNLREVFEEGLISLSELTYEQQREIKFQLGAIKKIPETKKIQIIKKSEIKKELGGGVSPDEADMLAMLFAKKESSIRAYAGSEKRKEYDVYLTSGKGTWMSI